MIVQLTVAQHEYVLGHLDGPVIDFLTCDVTRVNTTKVRVNSIAPAWVIAREALYDIAYTPRGTRAQGVSLKLSKALQSIQQAINAWMIHPALRGQMVLRAQVERVPAWTTPEGVYSPLWGEEFVILEPQLDQVNRGLVVTRWLPRRPSTEDVDWTCQEATHLRLRTHLQAALGWHPDVRSGSVDE